MGSILDDINIAGSNSAALGTTQSTGSVFNFKSKGAKGSVYATETGATSTAKATASKGGAGGSLLPILIIGGAVVAIGAAYYLAKR